MGGGRCEEEKEEREGTDEEMNLMDGDTRKDGWKGGWKDCRTEGMEGWKGRMDAKEDKRGSHGGKERQDGKRREHEKNLAGKKG